ncbi:MAG TPA: GNAT family N-acetyltransferase [Solirubrobacteraceae bacterium]|nr:GNAT family N-acetyltransferase [Solirubrobacteraceae bacterium]
MSATRPAGSILRHPTPADADAVVELLRAREEADLGRRYAELDDLRAEWALPGFDLAQDAWVAQADDAIVGYASLADDDLLVAVHPGAAGRGYGAGLRELGEARAAARGTRVLRQFVPVADTRARVQLLDAGWWPVQHYFRLGAALDRVPEPPAVRVRTFDAERDAEPVWHLVHGAYAHVEGFLPQPLEAWRAAALGKPDWDPALWLLLDDADGLAGVALGERGPRNAGLVHTIAVAERARGRGHGRALLLHLLAAFRAAELRGAEASVHGPTAGAAALYESAGMEIRWHAERWEKSLGR